MMLIVGLGNPGLTYKKTRHNVGFLALDVLGERHGIRIKSKGFSALYGEGTILGERVILAKPQTYMNNSGESVVQLMHYFRLEPEQLVVLYDDIDLPTGHLRIRASGTGGSHNGMRSILACIHSEKFPRVRIGIGKDESLLLRDYVLKKPSKAESTELDKAYENAADAVEWIVSGRLNEAQARFNKKHEGAPSVSVDRKQ